MHCTACHRRIKSDRSVNGAQLGPVCAKRLGVAAMPERRPAAMKTARPARVVRVEDERQMVLEGVL
jgi:hypothetical protein